MKKALAIIFVSVVIPWSRFCVAQSNPAKAAAEVPFVGCKSDGQTGPVEAPAGKNKRVVVAPKIAQQLAYYQAENGFGILAPRGWYCFGTYGSSGDSLYVSPQPIDPANLFASKWKGFTGPAIQMSRQYGGTSGRFGVAHAIARVFPAHREFVRGVIAEGIEPARAFPSGPYPNDKLVYKSQEIVEYETPGLTDGLGTDSRLQKSNSSIHGVAILIGPTPDLLQLSARLPPDLAELTGAIIRAVEHDARQSQAGGQ